MKVTLNHPASSYGVPVILDDAGKVMDYADGIKLARAKLGLSVSELAALCGVSGRTVYGWEGGRMPEVAALNVLMMKIRR